MRYILNILLVFFNAFLVFTQSEYVSIVTEVQDIYVGDNFTFKAVSPISSSFKIQYPAGFKKGNLGQKGVSQQLNYSTGKMEEMFYTAIDGTFNQQGTYKFVVSISTNKNKIISDFVIIRVHQRKKTPIQQSLLSEQFNGVLEASNQKVYVGEPVFVGGKLFTLSDIAIKDYHHFLIASKHESFKVNALNQRSQRKEMIAGKNYNVIDFDQQIVYFQKVGKHIIDPFELSLYIDEAGEFKIRTISSNQLEIEVMPLPSNPFDSFSNGVGKFKIAQQVSKSTVKQGEIIEFEVVISGVGNIHDLNAFVFNCPKGFRMYGAPEIKRSIVNSILGTEGTITYKYYLQAIEKGNSYLDATKLVYFDPVLGKFQRCFAEKSFVNVLENQSFIQQKSMTEEKMLAISSGNNTDGLYASRNSLTEKIILFAGIGSPVLLLLYLFLFVRKRKGAKEMTDVKDEDFSTMKVNRIVLMNELLASARMLADATNYDLALKELETALKYALANKFNCDDAQLNKHHLNSLLAAADISESLKAEIIQCFISLEEGRYLMVDCPKEFEASFIRVKNILGKLS